MWRRSHAPNNRKFARAWVRLQRVVGSAANRIGVVIVLAVVLPEAHGANDECRGLDQGQWPAAGASGLWHVATFTGWADVFEAHRLPFGAGGKSESDPHGSRNLTHPATDRLVAAESAIEI